MKSTHNQRTTMASAIIHCTRDYGLFKPLFCNRGKLRIDKEHLARLEESILECNLLKHRPILVNSHYEIIDGHHRFEIAKKNNLDLYYTIESDADYTHAIRLTRGTTNWTFKGFIECRALNNEEDYVKLNKFLEDNNITVHNLFRFLSTTSHSGYWISKIKKGTYKFDPVLYDLIPAIKKIHEIFDVIKQEGEKKYKFDKTSFWYGCYLFVTHPQINWILFKDKLPSNIHMLIESHTTWTDVVRSLCRIYNKDLKKGTIRPGDVLSRNTNEAA